MAERTAKGDDGEASDREDGSRQNAFTRTLRQPIVAGIIVTVIGSLIVAALTGDLFAGGDDDEAKASGPPVEVTVGPDEDWLAGGWFVTLPGDLPPNPPQGGCAEARAWLLEHDATDADQTDLNVVLTGSSDESVAVTGARVEVVERREPLDGTVGACPPPAGAGSVTRMFFDLDEEPSRALSIDGSDRSGFFTDTTITVAPGEAVPIKVSALTKACFCSWRLVFELSKGGVASDLVVDDDGKPFATTALVSPRNQYDWGPYGCKSAEVPCQATTVARS